MKTKEAINILNHAIEYFDMNYDTGDRKDTVWEKCKVWKALNHVENKLKKANDDSIKEEKQLNTINKGDE